MTNTLENLPAIREPTRLDDLARLGSWLALSESRDEGEKARGAAAALRLYYAAELGLTPLAAAELSIIAGRLVVSARLLRALAGRSGYHVFRVDSSNETCTARLVNPTGVIMGEATFTLEDARTAGLIRDRSAWKTHPSRMLWARASANVIYDFIPEVALGLITDDEAAEIQASDVDIDVPEDEIEWPDNEAETQILANLDELTVEEPDE